MSRETCLGCRRTVTTTGEPTDQAGLFMTNQRLDEVDAHGVAGVRDLPLCHATMWRAGALHIALCSDCQARIRDGLEVGSDVARVEARALHWAETLLRERASRASSAGATCIGLDGEIVRRYEAVYETLTEEADTLRARITLLEER